MGGMIQNCRVQRHQPRSHTGPHAYQKKRPPVCSAQPPWICTLTQENRKQDNQLFYSCIREQITAVLHFLMESRTNVTHCQQIWSRFTRSGRRTIPLPAYPGIPLGVYNSTISFLSRFSSRFKLVLDDHSLRGFGITPIRSSHRMGGHYESKGPLFYPKHEITRLCSSTAAIIHRRKWLKVRAAKLLATWWSPPSHHLDLCNSAVSRTRLV